MAKSVTLTTGQHFETITAAQAYFADLLKGQELGKAFSGNESLQIGTVYRGYCDRTRWDLTSPPASFYPTYDRGPGYTTRCFGVTFEDGTTGKFSLEKALRAIAA
jgi:hypothetical protein